MTEMSPDQIKAALKAGIITQTQADVMLAAQAAPNAHTPNAAHTPDSAAIGNEENLRFIRGFSDVFIAIGVGLLMLGLGAIGALLGGGLVFIGAAVVTAFMAEYFGRKKRSHLPTLITALAFLVFTLKGVSGLLGGSGLGGDILTALITLLAMSVFYWRVRLPFCIALITLAGLYLGLTLIRLIAPSFVDSQIGWVMAVGGLITLGCAIYYDSKDQHRTTRFSDNAFWLHLAAAPLLIHGIVFELIKTQTTKVAGILPVVDAGNSDAVLMLVIVGIVTLIGLILNRRALIVSSLLYALIALGFLLTKSGLGFGMALTLTLILAGAAITLLGVGWHPVRNLIIARLPKSRFIPVPYDPHFKAANTQPKP